ncbi:MAG TPA: RagB/SusD family nutrient uptake outer membrane protein [Lacibacter sp.]|nr:RagB/SusD family nutrient uptake outer membrane protein [Lacibacter sp.]HMO89157.1 RagB/SusD family nutrient uptake outer membrane protein [Lacibacter sp.]
MKKIYLMPLLLVLIGAGGCKKFLDRKPLDASSATNFLSNEVEMQQGLVGVYGAAMWVFPNNTPLMFAVEASTDLAIKRGGNAEDQVAMGENGPFLLNNDLVNRSWNQAYRLIQRANQQLNQMPVGQANVTPQAYSRIMAETITLRAWGYFHLLYMFGDVPFYTKPPTVSEVLGATRTPVATIVQELYRDLDTAVARFDAANAQPVIGNGRVNKAVALGIKAKLALLVKDYRTAAVATKAIMDTNLYGLNPNYPALFMQAGQVANVNREILFNQTYPTDQLNPQNWLVVLTIPRQVTNSQSSHFPSQVLVDLFEGRDGQRIDQSTVYDPANPRDNRDRRLRWTVIMQGDTVNWRNNVNVLPYVNPNERTIYNIYSNVRRRFNWGTGQFDNVTGNNDWIGAQAAGIQWQVSATGNIGGVGYSWRKYVDSTQYSWETKTGYILMRYADILLMYAEAKMELNEIDGTVLAALNAVRNRAGQPSVTTTNQAQLRTIIRRERAVEFGGEGLRLFDLRRWDIYAKANSFPVVGAAFDPAVAPATPSFDVDNVPSYTASVNQRIRFRNQTRNNSNNRYKLWPIPTFEVDVNPNGIKQNPGW